MASIHRRGGTWYASFRFGGTQFLPSLKTKSEKKADNIRGLIEETIRLLNTGRIILPPHAARDQILQFIVSGGTLTDKPQVGGSPDLETVCNEYFGAYTVGKEDTTVNGETIHVGHLKRLIGTKTLFSSLDTDKLQSYAAKRSKEEGLRGRKVSPETVKKEFRTFNQIWKMAVAKGYVHGPSPTKGVKLALIDEKPPFMTWDEIETIIKRGGLTEEQQKTYWDCLFLDERQVLELLEYVGDNAEHPFIHAAVAFAAFTGARRSEIVRSQIEDWDFERGIVRIREKKGSRKKKTTFREVNLHAKLRTIMEEWFKIHPGGHFAIMLPPNMANSRNKHPVPSPLTPDQAHDHFHRTIAGSKWQVLKGWHVLRHSFCSNCARRGVPDTIIDTWMGHRGDEDIKKRYRHLFPSDTREFIGKLFAS
jgi:integrase